MLRAGLRVEDQIKTLAELMMRRRLFVKADRMFKKPKPGKKRLAKWPKKLIPMYADQVNLSSTKSAVLLRLRHRASWPCSSNTSVCPQTFQEEFFYAWQYDRPSSPWLFVLSVLLVVVVILSCLFPLAPQPIKLAVVYTSMTLLIVFFTVISVRTVLAAISWIALGRPLWLFPYLLSEVSAYDISVVVRINGSIIVPHCSCDSLA